MIGRKNFLFANTLLGAQPSAVIYSLIETAKESGLDPFPYLTWALPNYITCMSHSAETNQLCGSLLGWLI